ncbi:WD repeat-containing protein [Niveomyces insectorum RCEF 264]|uniref:WD repeat-containing protein n=1 Tax=Niveomyces insectorum RCEF 264 TaxID=1081102 RepID=A0A167PW85_9HYPO|nr:WD repeat-containing protein [Niveomyces insectorum RCEF 264]
MDNDSGDPPGGVEPSPKATLVAAADLHSVPGFRSGAAAGTGSGAVFAHDRPFYKSLQWSADGTTVIASTSSNAVLSYVLPENLLEPPCDENTPDAIHDATSTAAPRKTLSHHTIVAQGRLGLPEPALSLAPAPYFNLREPWSQSALTGCRDLPIHLYPLFPAIDDAGETDTDKPRPPPLASYPLIKYQTEAYLAPTALLWSAPGNHFVAGAKNLLALFDVSRTCNEPPVLLVPTIPSTRHIRKGNGVGMRGTVSALAAQKTNAGDESTGWGGQGLVAAGTWNRWVGLYDLGRAGGDCVATWSVAGADGRDNGSLDYSGGGILQTIWSPCGRYLVVNERRAQRLLVYDVRGTGALLCCLTGRPADTNQRLSCDVYQSSDSNSGFEVWAGTQDGLGVVWEDVGAREGAVEPSWHWRAHESAMGSIAMHSSGSVLATCSGSWTVWACDDESGHSDSDNSSSSSDCTTDDNDEENGNDDNDETNDDDDDDDSNASDDSTESDDTKNGPGDADNNNGEMRESSDSSGSSSSSEGSASTNTTKLDGFTALRTSADVSLKIWSLV